MPLFTDDEYNDPYARPDLDEAWDRLPVLATIDSIPIRYLAPLVDLGLDGWLEDLGNAAWGYIEDCGWQGLYGAGGEMLDDAGAIRAEWASAFGRSARALAEAGAHAGPEGELERWASWICHEMADPHAYFRGLAEQAGAAR